MKVQVMAYLSSCLCVMPASASLAFLVDSREYVFLSVHGNKVIFTSQGASRNYSLEGVDDCTSCALGGVVINRILQYK